MKKKWIFLLTIICGAALVALALFIRLYEPQQKEQPKIIATSTLIEAIDVAELSAAEFTYNGIAQVYKDKAKTKVKCNIRYMSIVKAGIEMDEVEFEVDEVKKTVKPIIPKIKIESNLIDETSLSYIPANPDVKLKTALEACKQDAELEATSSETLYKTAEDNIKSIIEALLYPVVDSQGYKVIWE